MVVALPTCRLVNLRAGASLTVSVHAPDVRELTLTVRSRRDGQLVTRARTVGATSGPDHGRSTISLREVDEILECHLVSGGYDYLLRFLTRGVNHYQQVIESLLERNIGIEKYFSYIVIKSPFVKKHCAIDKLFPEPR